MKKVVLILWIVALTLSCASSELSENACQTNADCQSPKICENHICITPLDAGTSDTGNSDAYYIDINPHCQYEPPEYYQPTIKFKWDGTGAVESDYHQVVMTPLVINLTDDNGDGEINENDIPDIIFSTFKGSEFKTDGLLRAISGDDGHSIFTVTNPLYRIDPTASIAAGDILPDRPGPEIVALKSGGGTILFDHLGNLVWESQYPLDQNSEADSFGRNGAPAIADLDKDGKPEIIIGRVVLKSDGSLKWEGLSGKGTNTRAFGPISCIDDINNDGYLEVIAGRTVYSYDGRIIWEAPAEVKDGLCGIGKFKAGNYAQIVLVSEGMVHLLDFGASDPNKVLWSQPIPKTADVADNPENNRGGAPIIADFDGDGEPEIGVAGASYYVVFEKDGSIKWKMATQDKSSNTTGSSVFDFNGDTRAEVIYNDEVYLRVYKGAGLGDGSTETIFAMPNSSRTRSEYPVIADVDNDGKAEIIVCRSDEAYEDIVTQCNPASVNYHPDWCGHGLVVLKDSLDNWVSTRRIWNQHAYHITNVNEDGTIPVEETRNWESLNNYRQNIQGAGVFNAPDIAVTSLGFDKSRCNAVIVLRLLVYNQGTLQVGDFPVSLYAADPRAQILTALEVKRTSQILNPGEYEIVEFQYDNPPTTPFETPISLYVSVDDNGNLSGERNECEEGNNIIQINDVACEYIE